MLRGHLPMASNGCSREGRGMFVGCSVSNIRCNVPYHPTERRIAPFFSRITKTNHELIHVGRLTNRKRKIGIMMKAIGQTTTIRMIVHMMPLQQQVSPRLILLLCISCCVRVCVYLFVCYSLPTRRPRRNQTHSQSQRLRSTGPV